METRTNTTATLIQTLNEQSPLVTPQPSDACSQYQKYVITGGLTGMGSGGAVGTAFAMLMLIKPELFDSWDATLAVSTFFSAQMVTASVGAALGVIGATAFFGVKKLYECINKIDPNDVEEGCVLQQRNG